MAISARPRPSLVKSPHWLRQAVVAWRSDDASRTTLSSTGLVVSAVLVVIVATSVWRRPGHRAEGILVTLQLVGALIATPTLIRKLLPRPPLLTSRRLAGDTSQEPGRWTAQFEAAAFRLGVSKTLRAGLRRWRRFLLLGAILVVLAFLVQIVSLAAAFVLIWIGAPMTVFAIYGMVAPRRFHYPPPSHTEIVSPLRVAGDRRVEAALGIGGLVCVLASIAINFARLSF